MCVRACKHQTAISAVKSYPVSRTLRWQSRRGLAGTGASMSWPQQPAQNQFANECDCEASRPNEMCRHTADEINIKTGCQTMRDCYQIHLIIFRRLRFHTAFRCACNYALQQFLCCIFGICEYFRSLNQRLMPVVRRRFLEIRLCERRIKIRVQFKAFNPISVWYSLSVHHVIIRLFSDARSENSFNHSIEH